MEAFLILVFGITVLVILVSVVVVIAVKKRPADRSVRGTVMPLEQALDEIEFDDLDRPVDSGRSRRRDRGDCGFVPTSSSNIHGNHHTPSISPHHGTRHGTADQAGAAYLMGSFASDRDGDGIPDAIDAHPGTPDSDVGNWSGSSSDSSADEGGGSDSGSSDSSSSDSGSSDSGGGDSGGGD
jgi:uncharacterized membrane protein YgcG